MVDIESIKRRLKAITPGRREVEKDTGTGGFFVSALVGPGWETVARFGVRRGGDAVFDAHAPADIAALITEVEGLQRENRVLLEELAVAHRVLDGARRSEPAMRLCERVGELVKEVERLEQARLAAERTIAALQAQIKDLKA